MNQTLVYVGELTIMRCWCGIRHAVPSDLHDYQRRCFDDGRKVPDIWCPLGHTHVPADTPEHERLRASLERERNRSARLSAERDQEKASARAYKGAATKAKKRAAAALCPCCNRSFSQLARHMASQHPDYDPTA